jgi:predicted ATP-grasp superfamily ATP-dependent carboligase
MKSAAPAVLLGGLNVTRALGLGGVPVVVASVKADNPAFASRYCVERLLLPPLDDRGAVLDTLLRAGKRLAATAGARVPLFYSNDDWQGLVQDYRDELASYYALLLNDPEVADAVIEKDRFQALAAARGLPIPRTLSWQELEDFGHPVLVKPRSKFNWDASAVHAQVFAQSGKATVFPNGRALAADPAASLLREQLLVQEYIAGDDRNIWSFHGFCDETGRLLDWFVGRKIRTYPALTGTSTFLELAHDDEVAALGRRIASQLGLKGVFKIDLKRDALTGDTRLLEINARYNLWHYLGAANGVNLTRTAYDYLVHGARPSAPGRYRTSRRWVYLRYDWRAYRQLAARGELGLWGWLASLAGTPLVCELFAWSDPVPFFALLRSKLKSKLPRLTAVLRRWLSTAS